MNLEEFYLKSEAQSLAPPPPPEIGADGSLRIGITTGPGAAPEEVSAPPPPDTTPAEFVGEQPAPSMTAYDPTARERIAEFLQGGFEYLGMDRFRARRTAQSIIGGESSNLPLTMGLADIVPFLGTALQTQEAGRMVEDAATLAQRGDYKGAAVQAGLGALGLVPGVAGTVKAAKPAFQAMKDLPVGLSTKAVGEIPTGAPAPVQQLMLTGMDQPRMDIASQIVTDGVKSGMSPTKMIQAIEKQTGQKVTGRQQKEIKAYVASVAPKGQIHSDQAFKDLIAKPFPFEPSTQRFSQAFDDAIGWLKTLDAQGLRDAAIQADQRLAPILGVAKDGKAKRLLATNGKLLKTETGVPGGVPVELPDGRNIESAGLAISPAYKTGKFSTCPNSASCAQECLGKTSGGYFAYGGGADLEAMKGTRLRSFRMTQAMFREPEAFAIKLHNEIISLKNKAAKGGNAFAVRLNVLSDIDPRVHKSLIEAHPDVFFYDYTKMKYRPVAPNHHYTYSSTGASQKAGQNGLTADVDNPHTNWIQMRTRLDDGYNVAMAFSSKKALPESVLDEATGKTYRVIDGDAYDFRPLDAQPAGSDGVIIGLKNKAMTRKESAAASDSNGFFVQYDPKLGTQVVIPPQKREAIMIQSGNEQAGFTTGEQVTGEMK